MQVWLNDSPLDLPHALTLDEVLKQWADVGSTFAVAVNHIFIPKASHTQTMLQAGDRIDIVTPMQGG